MIISISGLPGSGKSTVAKIVAKRLGLKRYYMGAMRREMARKKGMTLEELNEIGEREAWTDKEVDDYQKALGENEDDFVIEGRTSFFLIPHSVKIFLDVGFNEGARRVLKDVKEDAEKRNEGALRTFKDAKAALRKRIESDRKRYRKYYYMDVFDKSHYDLVIDTTKIRPEEVADRIINFLRERGLEMKARKAR